MEILWQGCDMKSNGEEEEEEEEDDEHKMLFPKTTIAIVMMYIYGLETFSDDDI